MRLLPDTPSPFAWTVLVGAAVATATASTLLGFSVPIAAIRTTIMLVAGLLALAALSQSVWNKPAIAEPCALFAFWVAMLAILLPASYILAALDFPLIDMPLSRMDQAIGFDWRWLQHETAKHRWLASASSWLYLHSILQLPLALICLAATRELVRLNVCISGFILATIATLVLSGVLPAVGAYYHYGVVAHEMGHISEFVIVQSHLDHFWALRSGTLRHLDITYGGIVTFPSYHSVVALVSGWAVWRVRFLGLANAVISGLVILTTLPIGGHHLMDIFGAAIVVAASLKLAAWAERPQDQVTLIVAEPVAPPDFVWTRTAPSIGLFRRLPGLS